MCFSADKVAKSWKYAQKVRWTSMNLSHNRECASIDCSGGLAERVSSASSLLSKLKISVIEVENSLLVRLTASQGAYIRDTVHIRK